MEEGERWRMEGSKDKDGMEINKKKKKKKGIESKARAREKV